MRYLLWSVLLAMVLTAVVLISRPLLPVDETRYVTVAWEAHLRGDYLVSHLHGEPYSHKPPLLFWLINAVWAFTGVSEIPARVVAPAAGILCLWLTRLITQRLWPACNSLIHCAPVVHVSVMLWIVFCPVTMFDTLLTSCTMTALLGVLMAAEGTPIRGWLLAGVGMGLGILTKGPVVLVHVLPAAILAPWWTGEIKGRKLRWYCGVVCSIAVAAAIGLSWAVPSAVAGGKAYANELLFGQTAGRMVNSFAHRQPMWWYLPWLPLCLMPWISFGAVWRGLRRTPLDRGLKFLLSWAGTSLIILSLVSGKQIYYLLPIFPACAIILARLATSAEGIPGRRDLLFIVPGTVGMATLPIVFNSWPELANGRLSNIISNTYVVPLMICGLFLLVPLWRKAEGAFMAISASSIVFISLVVCAVSGTVWDGFDLKPLATFVARTERPVAWYGEYQGQLSFIGRTEKVHEADELEPLRDWLKANPVGLVIVRLRDSQVISAELAKSLRAADRTEPVETAQEISDLLIQEEEFPFAEKRPLVLFVQRIRKGLTFEFAVVVSYREAVQ